MTTTKIKKKELIQITGPEAKAQIAIEAEQDRRKVDKEACQDVNLHTFQEKVSRHRDEVQGHHQPAAEMILPRNTEPFLTQQASRRGMRQACPAHAVTRPCGNCSSLKRGA